ncbi:MAG: hypothetical protein IJZ30_05475 [Alphaproteobacteria bacterium]|nr:hypothetical protein [Alphaproteobacteria bacterium]
MNIEEHIQNLRKKANGNSFSILAERCVTSSDAPYRIKKAKPIKRDDVVVLCIAGSGGDEIFLKGYNSMLKKVDGFVKEEFGGKPRVVVAVSEFGKFHDHRFARKAMHHSVSWPKHYEELKRSVEEKYFEETFNPKYIRDIFDEVLKPRIEDDDGNRFELDEALRNVRKVNIVTHCHGGYVAMVLEEMMKKRMEELSYSKVEQKKIAEQLLVVGYNPDCPYVVSDTKFIGIVSSQDRSNRYNNYMREWLLMKPQHFGVMYMPKRWGRTLIGDVVSSSCGEIKEVEEISDLFTFKRGIDEHMFWGYEPIEGMSKTGELLQKFGANVLYNGIDNSLKQDKKFVQIPNIRTLTARNFGDRVLFAKSAIIGYKLEQKLRRVDRKEIDAYANWRRSIPVVTLD